MLSLIPKFALWPFVRQVASKGMTAIAVGASGLIARTQDGSAWQEVGTGITTESLFQSAYGNNVWMACGANCTVLRSIDDGVTWEKLVLPAAIVSGSPMTVGSVVFDSGRFLFLSNNASYFYTTDNGATWSRQTYTSSTQAGFQGGKARRISNGAVYQPGVGNALRGHEVFTWNGNGYTVTEDNPTSGSSYIVQSTIAESKEYLVSVQQGSGSWRRKLSDTAWATTRAMVGNNAMLPGGSAVQASTDTVFQLGNTDTSPVFPQMYKGVAGTDWTEIPRATLQAQFGANQILRDIVAAGTGSIVIGGANIYFSSDWAAWSLKYTARANVLNVCVKTVSIGDTQRWKHISFATNEAIDDVTEKFAVITTGAPTFTANRMTTTNAGMEIALKDSLLFGANEDFTISIIINPTVELNSGLPGDIIIAGAGNTGNDTPGAWFIMYTKNAAKFVLFFKVGGVGPYVQASSAATVIAPANTDMHLEFSRLNGQFQIFINGVKQSVTLNNAGGQLQTASMRPLGIGSPSASYAFRGTRRGFYIDKGICRHTNSFVPDTTVQTYVRPVYGADDAKAIRAQIGFRRDAVIDEANDRVIVNTGGVNQVVQQGRMKFTGTQASTNGLTFLMDPFGAGDFTIECCFNTSAAGATAGFLLLSEWWLGSATNDLNRWALLIDSGRKAYFQMNKSTVGTDAVSVYSTVALALNTDYKVIVERVSGVLNLYVLDPYTGVQVDKQSAPCTFPIRGAAPHFVRNYSQGTGNYSGTGYIWDIRIADKALYNGAVGISATLPGLPDNTYSTTEAAAIVAQATFARSPRDDKTGALVSVEAAAGSINYGRLSFSSNSATAFSWGALTPNFGAADFTIEMRVLPGTSGISGNPVFVIGQFLNSSAKNSWHVRLMDGCLGVVFSPTGAALTGLVVLKDTAAYVPGQEYFIVAERVGTTVTLYVDGVPKATATLSGALPTSDIPIKRGDVGTCAAAIRDVRISSTSQYKGVVPTFPQFKRFSTTKPSITMGFFQGDAGTIYGYMENSSYSVSSGNGAYCGLGSCTHKLFKYISGGTTIVRRLKGLFMDRGSYLILGWEDTTLTPTADMLTWTNTLVINGVSFVNNSQPVSGFVTPQGGTSIYWSGASAMNPLVEGREIAFEFI